MQARQQSITVMDVISCRQFDTSARYIPKASFSQSQAARQVWRSNLHTHTHTQTRHAESKGRVTIPASQPHYRKISVGEGDGNTLDSTITKQNVGDGPRQQARRNDSAAMSKSLWGALC